MKGFSRGCLVFTGFSVVSAFHEDASIFARDSKPDGLTTEGVAPDCDNWYTVKKGDDCPKVEKQFGISHEQFLKWNPAVSKDCATNFWVNYAYCVGVDSTPNGSTMEGIAPDCEKYYTIKEGDDCPKIEKQFDISHEQFLEWNPAVSKDCATNFWINYAYCVGVDSKGSTKTTTTTTTTGTTTGATTVIPTTSINATYSIRHPTTSQNLTAPTVDTAWPPVRTMAGQPTYCNKWYSVGGGDDCDAIVSLFAHSVTKEELIEWNPSLHTDCSGLYVGWSICVGIQAQSSLTLVYPTATSSFTTPEVTSYTPTTISSMTANFTASPTQANIVSSCQGYYQATAGDSCDSILSNFQYINSSELHSWNPALGDHCEGLRPSYYYCVAAFPTGYVPPPPTETTAPSPIASGTAKNCAAWYYTTGGDTCDLIVLMFGTFNKTDFVTWNPSVSNDCSNIKDGTWYCVATPETPKTRTAPISSATFPTDNPKQSGIASNCSRYWTVSSTDTCKSIADNNGLSLDTFLNWNPAIGGSSCKNLVPDDQVCVAVSSVTGARATMATASSTEPPSTMRTT